MDLRVSNVTSVSGLCVSDPISTVLFREKESRFKVLFACGAVRQVCVDG